MNREEVMTWLDAFPHARIAYHYKQNSHWQYTTVEEMNDYTYYNHRDVLPNEIVIDLDEDSLIKNAWCLGKICSKLKKKGIIFSAWHTGNMGYHIHIFWKKLDTVKENQLLKEILLDWMMKDLPNMKVDRQLLGRHLVRLEYGHHEKKIPKESLKTPVLYKDHHTQENDIPEHIWDEYKKRIVKFAIKRMTYKNKGVTEHKTPACIQYMLSDEFSKHRDGGKRAMFVLASYFHKMEDEKLCELLKRFNRYNLRKPLSSRAIIATILSVRNHKGRRVGCRYRHSLLKERS